MESVDKSGYNSKQKRKGYQSSPNVNSYPTATISKDSIKEAYIKALSGETPKTHLMVCTELAITASSYTSLKRQLENRGKLFELYQAPCKVGKSKRLVWYLTTNKALALKYGLTPEINALNIKRRTIWIKGKFGKLEGETINRQTKLFL